MENFLSVLLFPLCFCSLSYSGMPDHKGPRSGSNSLFSLLQVQLREKDLAYWVHIPFSHSSFNVCWLSLKITYELALSNKTRPKWCFAFYPFTHFAHLPNTPPLATTNLTSESINLVLCCFCCLYVLIYLDIIPHVSFLCSFFSEISWLLLALYPFLWILK